MKRREEKKTDGGVETEQRGESRQMDEGRRRKGKMQKCEYGGRGRGGKGSVDLQDRRRLG